MVCDKESLLIILGGDFNLIRELQDKSNGIGDIGLMDKLNEFIGRHQLRELVRARPRFTWTNKQENPVMAKLDRLLISTGWEARFPLSFAWSLTRVGSDHSPIIMDSGEQREPRPKYFYFENQWLLIDGFREKLGINGMKVKNDDQRTTTR